MAKTRFDGRRSNWWDWNGKRTPEAEARLEERRKKRKEREASRAIPNISLSQEEARKRTSPTALSKELGLPREVVKALLPKRKRPAAKTGVMSMGRAVKLLNESKSVKSVLQGLLKP